MQRQQEIIFEIFEKNFLFQRCCVEDEPSMLRLPSPSMTILSSSSGISWSLYHQLILGFGSPDDSQWKVTGVRTGTVWLTGPNMMMGGGRSPFEITSRYALDMIDSEAVKIVLSEMRFPAFFFA